MPNNPHEPDDIKNFEISETTHYQYNVTEPMSRDELQEFLYEVDRPSEDSAVFLQYEIVHEDGSKEWLSTHVTDWESLDLVFDEIDDGEAAYDGTATGAYGITVVAF